MGIQPLEVFVGTAGFLIVFSKMGNLKDGEHQSHASVREVGQPFIGFVTLQNIRVLLMAALM